MQHGIGDGPPAYVVEVVHAAFERGTGDGRAQAGLGRHLTAVPAQGPVPHRRVDALTSLGQGGSNIGKVKKRG
ncbi:hypothetical protein Aab01nite_69720 [Paractinoplanes abujensis]|nr:hypothetical protein Aab01nite_69720 [Actinoplanes abujensis]